MLSNPRKKSTQTQLGHLLTILSNGSTTRQNGQIKPRFLYIMPYLLGFLLFCVESQEIEIMPRFA
jgi:hypothetical protein